MPRYEGISTFHHEAKKRNERFIDRLTIVEALNCTAMKASDGFNNSTSKQVGRFHSCGVDAVVAAHYIYKCRIIRWCEM